MQDAESNAPRNETLDRQDSTSPGCGLSSARSGCRAVVAERIGLLLVGHGTRDPQGLKAFSDLVQMTRACLPEAMLAPAFLEFAEPTIERSVEDLAEAGASRIIVVPFMLLAGGHVQRDIPSRVAAAVARRAGIKVIHTAHLGCSPQLIALSAQRFREALAGTECADSAVATLLVGRGSRDAGREIAYFSQLRRTAAPEACLEVCFLSLSRPSLEQAIVSAASWPQQRIVVQPHLLFPGHLFDRVVRVVRNAQGAYPEKQWIAAQPLGPDRLLADMVATLYRSQLTECVPHDPTAPVARRWAEASRIGDLPAPPYGAIGLVRSGRSE